MQQSQDQDIVKRTRAGLLLAAGVTAVAVGGGVRTVPVVLNYRNGLSIGPVGR